MTYSSNEPKVSVTQVIEGGHTVKVAAGDFQEMTIINSADASLIMEPQDMVDERTIWNWRYFERRFRFVVMSPQLREQIVDLAAEHYLSDTVVKRLHQTGHLEVTSDGIKLRRVPGLYHCGLGFIVVLTILSLDKLINVLLLPSTDLRWLLAFSVYPLFWGLITRTLDSYFLMPERETNKLLQAKC